MTLVEICRHLAKQYQVKGCCTLTAGIFTMTAANAAEERKNEVGPDFVPYWRTLKSNGELNAKYPGGVDAHAALLQGEGFVIIRRGKRAFVKDFQNFLYEF